MIDNQDRPHVKKGAIKYTKGYRSRIFFSKTINALIILSIMAVTALFIFIFIKQPVKTNDGYITATPAYELLTHGDNIIVVPDKASGALAPIKRFFVKQDYFYARVVAGPYGEIKQTANTQSVDDGNTVVGVNLGDIEFEEGQAFLDTEYIVRKIDEYRNDIENEFDMIITKDNVLGKFNVQN